MPSARCNCLNRDEDDGNDKDDDLNLVTKTNCHQPYQIYHHYPGSNLVPAQKADEQ